MSSAACGAAYSAACKLRVHCVPLHARSQRGLPCRVDSFLFPTLTGVFITVFGAAFLALGGWLLALGGSPYYVVAGTLLVVSGVLMIMGREGSLWWYFALFIGTLAWSLFEVGLDGWKLMPRIFLFAVLGIWCSLPMVVRPLTARHAARISASVAGVIYALSIIGIFWSGFAVTDARHVQYEALSDLRTNSALPAVDTVDTDWRYYGHTMAGTRYSPLGQITGTNVKRLRKAWQYETGDLPRKGETTAGREFNFEATPIKVGDRLYLCTPHRHVIALDATTGKPIWTFDPHAQTAANEYLACRGVAY
ncbi:hypothetical protein [Caballeronia sp. LZ035]|uniref:hypothetical protein n=1 Tax=Caballeronia sp. LZ035 TaxID=3038568 RepID=UPI002860BD58|nr:hypothetical protein [Caballeronia sp. LZ035]MDR5763108.1 hypothetical protein [Caballeronia sp. LZ035]